MIVMDEETCMVDVARYFTEFLVDESCGKCTTCREGLRQMSAILTGITQGRGKKGDVALLGDLAEVVTDASLCALGGTAANPLLSTLTSFAEEYREHIEEHVCRALVCKPFIAHAIDEEKCTACAICRKECPSAAIAGGKKEVHRIDPAKCIACGVCFDVCRYGAVVVSSGKFRRRSAHTKTNLKPVKERAS
jgi:ferredoxin